MKINISFLILVVSFLMTGNVLYAQSTAPITVKVDQFKTPIQPTMWGIFFEDINLAADGGIYAEMIKNRSFEFSIPQMGWKVLKKDTTEGMLIINRGKDSEANPRFMRVTKAVESEKFGLQNAGFRGMGIKQGMDYHFSVLVRQAEGSSVRLRLELLNSKGETVGSASLTPDSKDWKRYTADFKSTATDPKGRLVIWVEGTGSLDIDMISLFPGDTWKGRPGGLRNDLVQLLADLKPGFVRFPGGCIVEGRDLANRYQWKKTVGKVEERELIINRWNTEFKHRPTPDYFQSFGLGFYEYFLLSEDIGAQPLPILNCGMACQFNTGEVVPVEQLDPYIQDALDLIEFANGDATTKWGKLRAEMGHPAPFNLKMIGIGNEQWGQQYIDRYVIFTKAIKEKYPNITIVSSVGPSPDGKFFDFASKELKRLGAEIVDEHYYANPEWFFQNANRYDNYDRSSYKIFAGEFAAQSKFTTSPDNQNNWKCALSEAAFMTGLERNADIVTLCSYAPLLAHVDGWQWTPDLIWFDNLRSFGTANYYVQKLYSNNKGTQVLIMLSEGKPLTGQNGLYASAAFDEKTQEVILKLVNSTDKVQQQTVALDSKKKVNPKAMVTVLKSANLEEVNSLDKPMNVFPEEKEMQLKGKTVNATLEPYSFSVIRIKMTK